MSQQDINLGTPPLGQDGDTFRSALQKCQANFNELYAALGGGGTDVIVKTVAGVAALEADNNVPAAGLKTALGIDAINARIGELASTTGLSEGTNLYFTSARVRSTPLDGVDVSLAGTVDAGDSVLAAIGKLQRQITAGGGGGSGPTNTDGLAEGLTNLYFTQPRVRSTPLTGLDTTGAGAVIVAGDSVLSALGRLQAQISTQGSAITSQGQTLGTHSTQIGDLQTAVGLKMANPMTAVGDLIVGGTAGAPQRLPRGANNQVLTSNGTTVAWADPTGGGGSSSFTPLDTPAATANGQTVFTLAHTAGLGWWSQGGVALHPSAYTETNAGITLLDGSNIRIGQKLTWRGFNGFTVPDALPAGGTAADSFKLGGVAAATVLADVADRMRIRQATAQLTTSGTLKDFTGIDSWAKQIVLSVSGVMVGAPDTLIAQLGTSAGVENTGYGSGVSYAGGTNLSGGANSTAGMLMTSGLDANIAVVHGTITFTKQTGNTWVQSTTSGRSNTNFNHFGGGSKTLAGALDRVRLTTLSGATAFTAGSVNVTWMG